MTSDAPTSIEEKLFHCWRQGIGIGETRLAVQRAFGTRPSFEQVRTAFADLSHRLGGIAA